MAHFAMAYHEMQLKYEVSLMDAAVDKKAPNVSILNPSCLLTSFQTNKQTNI